jgi:tRNA pseudouridine55 synthase
MAQSIDGIVIIDKPAGITSHDVVARARRIFGTRRIGHTGTLDPFATGVLVLCLGRMTRLSQFLTASVKEYEAVMRLGRATDTGDLTGTPLEPFNDPSAVSLASVRDVLADFHGPIQQIPPMYAAKKVGGVKLYEMARRGEVIERKPVEVEIREIEINEDSQRLLPPGDVALRVSCSAGTYIRTLAEDIGVRLGVGAHLISLRRTRAGECSIEQSVALERLEELKAEDRLREVFQDAASVVGLDVVKVDSADELRIRNGVAVSSGGATIGRALLCSGAGAVLAVAELDVELNRWRPKVVIAGV